MKRRPSSTSLDARVVGWLALAALVAGFAPAGAAQEAPPLSVQVCAQQVQDDALESLSLRIAATEQQQRAQRAERAAVALRDQLRSIIDAADGAELPEDLRAAIDSAAIMAAPKEE